MTAGTSRLSLKAAILRIPPVVWALLLMVLVFSQAEPRFLTLGNAVNLFRQGSILMILCMGVVVAKITGGIDLSVGGVMTLAGMLMAWALTSGHMPIPMALLISLLVGAGCGFLNGIFVAKMNIPSFIATLGTQGMAIGLCLGMNQGNVISGLPGALDAIGNGSWLGIPVPIWASILAFMSSFVLLSYTRFGVYIYALGGNEEALKLAGQPAWWYRTLAFTYAGLMAGLAAIIITSRNMAAQPTVGLGMEFEAFSGTVLGGSFVAGRGGAFDTVLGVMFILILRNGLNVMGVPTYYQLAIIGVVLIAGIIMSLLVEQRLQKQR
jgi:ribose transport system permease protein